jgi:hypothetical protein
MQFHLLLTNQQMAKLPSTVALHDCGILTIITEDGSNFTGNNVVVNGSKEDIVAWLSPYEGVWVNNSGSVFMEEFTIMHISPEALKESPV